VANSAYGSRQDVRKDRVKFEPPANSDAVDSVRAAARVAEPHRSGGTEMLDLVLVLLTVAIFIVFAVILRGSERL